MNDDQTQIKKQWKERSLAEQMGNIGSEVGRALKWENKNEKRKLKALDRALELFDFTVEDKRWDKNRLREIGRSREVLNDYFFGDNEYNSDAKSLEKYFNYFAILARKDSL